MSETASNKYIVTKTAVPSMNRDIEKAKNPSIDPCPACDCECTDCNCLICLVVAKNNINLIIIPQC